MVVTGDGMQDPYIAHSLFLSAARSRRFVNHSADRRLAYHLFITINGDNVHADGCHGMCRMSCRANARIYVGFMTRILNLYLHFGGGVKEERKGWIVFQPCQCK